MTGARLGHYFGGVALAFRKGTGTILGTESTWWFVAAAVELPGGVQFLVVGVYVLPHESSNVRVKYVDILGTLHEMVGCLSLAHSIPPSHMLMVGDWNAHVGRLPCGLVVDAKEGNFGGPRGHR